MATHGIAVSNLSKTFGRESVLTDVDLTVDPGEFCVVVGPSGCGKSTLLKCIAGLHDIDAGHVELDGRDVTTMPIRETDVGFVFQEFENTLFPHKTVAENVAFGLEQQGDLTSEAIDDRVDSMLELLAIAESRDDTPSELSGGQQQRVELARQLVRDCETMLLDDPLADLDYKLQKRMELELRRLHADSGSTYVYVTHNQEQALELADTLVVMNDGQIEQVGAPTEVYDRPATAFVGRFVGDSNLFRSQLRNRNGEAVTVETDVGEMTATTMARSKSLPDESVTIVRPENAVLGEPAKANAFEGTLEGRTYTGERTEFTVAVPARDGTRRSLTVVEPGEATAGDLHESVTVGWDATDAVYFDTVSVTETTTIDDLEVL